MSSNHIINRIFCLTQDLFEKLCYQSNYVGHLLIFTDQITQNSSVNQHMKTKLITKIY